MVNQKFQEVVDRDNKVQAELDALRVAHVITDHYFAQKMRQHDQYVRLSLNEVLAPNNFKQWEITFQIEKKSSTEK